MTVTCLHYWRVLLFSHPLGVLVLEELEHAKARGARIYAEYVGGAFTCDAHHMTEPQPQGRGVSSCLHKALESAGALEAVQVKGCGYLAIDRLTASFA